MPKDSWPKMLGNVLVIIAWPWASVNMQAGCVLDFLQVGSTWVCILAPGCWVMEHTQLCDLCLHQALTNVIWDFILKVVSGAVLPPRVHCPSVWEKPLLQTVWKRQPENFIPPEYFQEILRLFTLFTRKIEWFPVFRSPYLFYGPPGLYTHYVPTLNSPAQGSGLLFPVNPTVFVICSSVPLPS